jgi:hypothetical protein
MLVDQTINAIIHEVNVAHSLNWSPRARYQIMKHCVILSNKSRILWNEEDIWLNCNPEATVAQIKVVRDMLDNGKDIRGFKFKGNSLERWMP